MTLIDFLRPAVLAAAMTLGIAPASNAATFAYAPTNVAVTGLDFCLAGDCTLTGQVAGDGFDLTYGQSITLPDFIQWNVVTTGFATGGGIYTVDLLVPFTGPGVAELIADGYAGFGVLLGAISGEVLVWSNPTGIIKVGKYSLFYELDDLLTGGFGTTASSGATFTLLSPVPLPAAAWMLAGGLAGLGMIARKRRSLV